MSAHTLRAKQYLQELEKEIFEQAKKTFPNRDLHFDGASFAQAVSQAFSLSAMDIVSQAWEWRNKDKVLEGFSQKAIFFSVSAAPLEGLMYWACFEEDALFVSEKLAGHQGLAAHLCKDEAMRDALWHFLALELMLILHKSQDLKDLNFRFEGFCDAPDMRCLTRQVDVQLKDWHMPSRLFVSESLFENWRAHFSQQKQPLNPEQSARCMKTPLELSVELGQVKLPHSTVKDIALGDFLILDSCSFDPNSEEKTALLKLGSKALWRAKVAARSLEIVDRPTAEIGR